MWRAPWIVRTEVVSSAAGDAVALLNNVSTSSLEHMYIDITYANTAKTVLRRGIEVGENKQPFDSINLRGK